MFATAEVQCSTRGLSAGYRPKHNLELIYYCCAVLTLFKSCIFVDMDRMFFFSALRYTHTDRQVDRQHTHAHARTRARTHKHTLSAHSHAHARARERDTAKCVYRHLDTDEVFIGRFALKLVFAWF
jgi:hypothetical protein